MQNHTEERKDIIGYEGLCQVSSIGNIKSFKNGKFGINKIGHILKNYPNTKGYYGTCLLKKRFLVHRLVAIHFIENIDNKKFINHINGVKSDNRYINLEWCNNSENQLHSYRILLNRGPVKGIVQYSKGNMFIRNRVCSYDVMRELGIDGSSIIKTCMGKRKTAGGYIRKYKI